jgi:hypothetical protein
MPYPSYSQVRCIRYLNKRNSFQLDIHFPILVLNQVKDLSPLSHKSFSYLN